MVSDAEQLRAELLACDDDDRGDRLRAVYGDLLQQRSEPQGRLIALHFALSAAPAREDLLIEERALRERLEAAVSFSVEVKYEWRLGFIEAVRVPLLHERPPGLLPRLLRHPVSLIRRLEIGRAPTNLFTMLATRPPPLRLLDIEGAGSEALTTAGQEALLERDLFPKLTSLIFRTPKQTKFITALAASPLTRRLTALGVDDADDALEALFASRQAFSHVRFVESPRWDGVRLYRWQAFLRKCGRLREAQELEQRISALLRT